MSQQRKMPRGHDLYLDVWHRKDSLQRFLGRQRAEWVSLIDIDCCEYCFLAGCMKPIALIETKLIWSADKTMTVTQNLAQMSGVTAYLVEYAPTKDPVMCDTCGRPNAAPDDDIEYFIIDGTAEKSPQEYAEWLWELRFPHWQNDCTNPAKDRMLAWKAAA